MLQFKPDLFWLHSRKILYFKWCMNLNVSLWLIHQGYRSQVCGSGQPEMSLGMFRQSRQSRSFSHFSTASPGAYRMDSWRETSWRERAVQGERSQTDGRGAMNTHTRAVKHRDIYLLLASLCWRSCSPLTGSADCLHSAASTAESVWGRESAQCLHTCRDEGKQWSEVQITRAVMKHLTQLCR